MNYLLISFALVATSMANTIGRVGLSPVPSPVSSPPSINVNLASDFLLTTLGFVGEATANQQIHEDVTGNNEVPASLSSSSSVVASLELSGVADEVVVVEIPAEAVSTVNGVNTQLVAQGSEEVSAALHGVNASVEYSGESAVPLGGGVSLVNASTDVEIIGATDVEK